MKKLLLICLISFFGTQFINSQVLTVCESEAEGLPVDFIQVMASGGVGSYTWYYNAPCSEVTTEEQCNASGGTCQWLFGFCVPLGSDSSGWFEASTGSTINVHSASPYNLKVVDALGQELVFSLSNLESCSVLGIEDNTIFSDVSIFPNPNQGLVNIDLGGLKNVNIKVFNAFGQLIYREENINESTYQFKLKESSGVCFVKLSVEQKEFNYKLIID